MEVAVVGLDIAKHVFQLHGVDEQGSVVPRRRLRRDEVAPFFANLPACSVRHGYHQSSVRPSR